MANVEELLKKAKKPAEFALKYHPFYQGKIEVVPKCPVRSFDDFAIWYTPGVAEPCKVINKSKDAVYELTNKWNTIAIVSDGTRVLGLGDIGPEAGMPVMEGKALLFKYLGGVDAFPICLDTKKADDIITAVKWLQPSFGGINLEDIEQPKCFYILDRLRKEAEIPVWHDDQQGTATVVVAGAINAIKVTGRKMSQTKMAIVGAGAACTATVRVLIAAGAKRENMIQVDSKGTLHPGRKDIEAVKDQYPDKWQMCLKSNKEGKTGGTAEAMKGAEIAIAMSKPGPGTITKEMVKGMASNSIVFAAANPVPEIWPWEAKEAGARIIATGRSDFPNQINNSLGFPGIFRGTLDVRAKTITDEMCIAAAQELAKLAEDRGLNDNYIIPNMDDWEVFPREARAVALKAIDQGIARVKLSSQELYDRAMAVIKRARDETQLLMKEGFISQPPP
jgi:malate dehydrogenase (oxaloacetate-decarboxylating)